MEKPAIHALDPYRFFSLTSDQALDTIKAACRSHHEGVVVLPTNNTTVDQLRKCLDFGASIILKHSAFRLHSLSSADRELLITAGKERVFFKGYRDGHCLRFLRKGASILVDGVEQPLTPTTIQQFCELPHTGYIKVLGHAFSDSNRRDLLARGIKMVYSWRTGQPVPPIQSLVADVAKGGKAMVLHLSDWPLAQALDILRKGGTILITGHTKWNRQQIEEHLIHPADSAERGRIKMLFRYGTNSVIDDLRQMAIIFSLEETSARILFN